MPMRTVRTYLPPLLSESQGRHPRLRSNKILIIRNLDYIFHILRYIYDYIIIRFFSYSLIINMNVFDPIPAIPASKLKIKNLRTRFQ